jgi:hypothetical protein
MESTPPFRPGDRVVKTDGWRAGGLATVTDVAGPYETPDGQACWITGYTFDGDGVGSGYRTGSKIGRIEMAYREAGYQPEPGPAGGPAEPPA